MPWPGERPVWAHSGRGFRLEVDPTGLALQMGANALIGAPIGSAAKKVAEILAIVVGLHLVRFTFLEIRGIVQINRMRRGGRYESLATHAPGQAPPLVDTVVSTAGIGVGFAAGFYLGLRRG